MIFVNLITFVHTFLDILSYFAVVVLPFCGLVLYEHVHEKTNNLGSDQVRHKLDCIVTGDG